jgi:hypothetical protein
MVAFKEQRIRYNRNLTHSSTPNTVRNISKEWSCLDEPGDGSPAHKFKVPDHIAAQRYRQKFLREHNFSKLVADIANKAANSGVFRAADIVAVHPARQPDPRSRKNELGTATIRKSKSNHFTPHTFSLVTRVGQRFKTGKSDTLDSDENKWYNGDGSDLQFKSLDLEAATEGEYWLIFRGFLLLRRDAAVGRFAGERKAGIGGGTRRDRETSGDGGEEDEIENRLHRDEFNEPITVGWMEKQIVKRRKMDTTYMEGSILPGAVPPPSDYFLGFRSPGTQVRLLLFVFVFVIALEKDTHTHMSMKHFLTPHPQCIPCLPCLQIWSRLRLAGFETQRVYSVDTRRVMIKIRCPEDRLLDVAEVLRIQLKTVDGKAKILFVGNVPLLFRGVTTSHFFLSCHRHIRAFP